MTTDKPPRPQPPMPTPLPTSLPAPLPGSAMPAAAPGTPALPRRFGSEALFAGRPEIEILHAGALYRLRRTATGKLILTK